MKTPFPLDSLKAWFYRNRRSLPWRDNPSPYAVWVSEVMLQQTQVKVVIPYFKRWMEAFPSIFHLARSSEERVIKMWEGLGYYSRARHLHRGARYLVAHHAGSIPSDPDLLKQVKGLGPYTVGAILSFAYKKRAPAVDGNVLRVMTRFNGIHEEIDKLSTRRRVEQLVKSLLPEYEPWIIMEGLIELGATVCQKKPFCIACPLMKECIAYRECKTDLLPVRKKRPKVEILKRQVALILSGEALLIRKGKKGQVMADLWEFPYCDLGEDIESILKIHLEKMTHLPEVSHGFTRFKATLYPTLYRTEKSNLTGWEWVSLRDLETRPFSAGHRKILKMAQKSIKTYLY